jgi:hypothetical protein
MISLNYIFNQNEQSPLTSIHWTWKDHDVENQGPGFEQAQDQLYLMQSEFFWQLSLGSPDLTLAFQSATRLGILLPIKAMVKSRGNIYLKKSR